MQTQSQNDLDTAPTNVNQTHANSEYTYRNITNPTKHIWQRSASCRELYDYSFEDSGQAKRRINPLKSDINITLQDRKLESPITRYDDHKIIYAADARNTNLEIHQDIMMPDKKVYSSSYPGTTSYSQESMEDPGNYDLRDSQDDLSHDSYELIERSDDDYSTSGDYKYKKNKMFNTRSCSLDSGNYLPSDSDSEDGKRHKCKSSSDVHRGVFTMDDPRDFPREIIPRKSDGSFYKQFKNISRTSSLESKSDYYESRTSKSSKDSFKKSKDRSISSRTSSQESKSDYENKHPIHRNKSYDSVKKHEYVESRGSSLDSKSEYYDALTKTVEEIPPLKYHHDYDRKIQFQRNYGTQKPKEDINNDRRVPTYPTFKETSHVHSVSLQNVETEQSLRSNWSSIDQNTIPRAQRSQQRPQSLSDSKDFTRNQITHIWPESIAGVPTEIRDWKSKQGTRSTESESNIFSFDEDKIQSMQESSDGDVSHMGFSVVPNVDKGKLDQKKKDNFKEVFKEIEPRILEKYHDLQLHQPIERTKSDPNSLARQRLNSNSRRLLLMHQKSIDLTPAESSDDDYLYKQIPSAPPIMKYRGTHFEMPSAEFGHFDILKRETEGQKTKFEVPKSQFEVLGAKTQSDFVNLPPKTEMDITYVLHKRHIMNGTASKEETIKLKEKDSQKLQNSEFSQIDENTSKQNSNPKSPTIAESERSSFLFTQNIDLSKVDPVTLEVDKSIAPIQHLSSPKRDITKIDPIMLEALNSKLSQIESDSPTSSKTESIKPQMKGKALIEKADEAKFESVKKIDKSVQKTESKQKIQEKVIESKPKIPVKDKPKTEGKPKRIIKPRMQPNKKGAKNKTKVRITSFSSDDESLDSDDVFGSAEAAPTKCEFSPPQTRKEMESILKIESERKYLQYTMSSTEVEGSPPQTRKSEVLYDRSLDPNFQTELRRISERSFSIPSSEDDLNIKTNEMQPVFADPLPDPLLPVPETEKEVDKSLNDTIHEQVTVQELLKEEDLKEIEVEKEKEKEQLKADIERDIRELRVPSRTKITEICSPSIRNKGHSPLLFAHARLNLSEGSAFSLLQKQQATESPIPGRRAKSLDAPVIPVSRLPPSNAFSSKDDTVEEEDQVSSHLFIESSDKEMLETDEKHSEGEKETEERIRDEAANIKVILEDVKDTKSILKDSKVNLKMDEASSKKDLLKKAEAELKKEDERNASREAIQMKLTKSLPQIKPRVESKTKPVQKVKSVEKDQIVPDVTSKPKRTPRTTKTISNKTTTTKSKANVKTVTNKEPLKTLSKEKNSNKSSLAQKSTTTKPPIAKPTIKKTVDKITPMSLSTDRTGAVSEPEMETKSDTTRVSLISQYSLALPEIKRTKSQEIESITKPPAQKEKAKSLEKLEFKRSISKERTKSQEESDSDIAKRKEKQQMLYEIAIKQSLKSPIKDTLPVFPKVEEMVRERHGKLEISINTIEPSVSLEEAIIITKSPKKLDKKMDKKYTKSLEINLNTEGDEETKGFQRMGKSLDLDNRKGSQDLEFDFKVEAIEKMKEETSPESDDHIFQKLVKVDIHKEPQGGDLSDDDTLQEAENVQDSIILEGTALDVWLSVDEKAEDKLEDVTIIEKSQNFFEKTKISKPPDLSKTDTKSSSDSQSMERLSLGNSLDMKYIDDSGDSSHKSEKDAQLIAELRKASQTVENFLLKKLKNRKLLHEKQFEEAKTDESTLVKITSEEESLTEVTDMKVELYDPDSNYLGVNDHKDALLKLSIERSRSEDTGSWVTVECEEYAGIESFEYDVVPLESSEKISDDKSPTGDLSRSPIGDLIKSPIGDLTRSPIRTLTRSPIGDYSRSPITSEPPENKEEGTKLIVQEDSNLLTTESKLKLNLLKRSSDQSKSSDTTGSWTSGEKDLSPGQGKENEESSLSCSLGKTIGLSQTIEKFSSKDQLDKSSPETEPPRSPRSPRICVLGRAFTIDEDSSVPSRFYEKSDESSSDGALDISKDLTPIQENESTDEALEGGSLKYKKKRYPFEEKWSSDSELAQKLHQKISRKLSSTEKNSMSSLDDPVTDRYKNGKSLHSVEKLSTESRNSLDTESSSGSFGIAVRMQKSGENVPVELSSTWRPFPLESSGSSSVEDGNNLPIDHELYGQEYFLCRDNSGEFAHLSDISHPYKDEDATPTGEATDFNYPALPSTAGLGPSEPGYMGSSYLSRTLSRISERSTNSEKSSVDEDSTKASTQSESVKDESNVSSNREASLSSDPPTNARVSESEKKISGTSSNNKVSSKNGEVHYNEALPNISLLQRQISDDRRTSAEMAELSIDDIEIITSEKGLRLKRQESEDTVIDEECFENDSRENKGSSSQESDEWPLPDIPQMQKPLMALHETPSSDTSQITTQVFQPPHKTIPKTFGLRSSLKSQDSEQWPSPPSSVIEPPIVGNVETYYMTPPEEACKVTVDSNTVSTYDNDSNSDNENKTLDYDGEKTHTYENVASTEQISESISESLSGGPSGVKIVLDKKSAGSDGTNSEEDLNISNLNDDVFTDAFETSSKHELRPPTVLRRSTNSEESSHSGKKNKELRPPSSRGSHSSYSDEDCTSSLGTTLEDGTVRYALKPTKCTHSSHSEDTSIALSLSEWSNSTNTVKFQNLSSNSGTTKSSSGLKSEENSLTDIAQSISEWSSSNSNTMKVQNLQFQKLSSNTSTGDSTLTEHLPTISDWSTSETTKTFVSKQFFPPSSTVAERQSISRLGSSIDEGDMVISHEQMIKSPQNIPSEDFTFLTQKDMFTIATNEVKYYIKSTERPILIPALSDTEKSTESSSMEQRTVHTQRYDKEKQKYSQKYQPSSKSTERPVKVPLKLSKCSPYYSSSLSSESTPMQTTSPIPMSKTATIPLTRSHRKPVSKHLFQAKSPPSENDSTSSMESPKSKTDSRRGYRRRKQTPQKKHKVEKGIHTQDDYFFAQEQEISEYNQYIRNKSMEEMACGFHYDSNLTENTSILQSNYAENLEEGYYPDGDSQSGSDIFRMEREEDERYEPSEGFDVSCIPPPLLEDDFESDRQL